MSCYINTAAAHSRLIWTVVIINAEEDLHCDVEAGLVPALDDMLKGKTDFYSDSDSAQEFLHAICFQYLRTKKMRQGFAAIAKTPVPGADMQRCRNLVALIASMRLADSLYRERGKYKILLLDNATELPLITGDQPIVNVHARLGTSTPPERLELFYPLSPKRAMMLIELATERSATLSLDDVRRFNEMIVSHSHEQVFSSSGQYLEALQPGRSAE